MSARPPVRALGGLGGFWLALGLALALAGASLSAVAQTPSAFVPLMLTPVEWRSTDGDLTFGWNTSE